MKQRFLPTRRARMQLTLLIVVSLLFQQATFATYLCPAPVMSASGMAMSADCHGMQTMHQLANEKTASALCAQHCAQQPMAAQDAHLPGVPPLFLFAPLPAQPALISLPAFRSEYVRIAKQRTSGIPPALRYRVLLI